MMFPKSGVTVPGVPTVDRGNWGREYILSNLSYRMPCFVRNSLERITPYRSISHTKMSIVFGMD